jgi:hypothetical protein
MDLFRDFVKSFCQQKKVKPYSTGPLKAMAIASILGLAIVACFFAFSDPPVSTLIRYDDK